MALSLLLSLATAASLSTDGACDWSIFLYLIAGDEQQRVSERAGVFQVVGAGLESVAVC